MTTQIVQGNVMNLKHRRTSTPCKNLCFVCTMIDPQMHCWSLVIEGKPISNTALPMQGMSSCFIAHGIAATHRHNQHGEHHSSAIPLSKEVWSHLSQLQAMTASTCSPSSCSAKPGIHAPGLLGVLQGVHHGTLFVHSNLSITSSGRTESLPCQKCLCLA